MKRITLALPAPYVGLRHFTEAEALLFFGRDAHVRDLLGKLERKQRFLAVLGASGTGKSSLVRAGLIPALHRGALHLPETEPRAPESSVLQWNVCIFQPGDAPLHHLAHALTEDKRWADSEDRAVAESSLATLLGASPLALADLYRQKCALFGGDSLLLVVDQFEEIFRYRQRNPDEADSFVKLLLRSASEDVPVYVVITMRSDFLGNAVAFHGLPEAINSGIYLTPRLDAEQIKSVITSPLALVGGSIDPVLANRLLNTLSGEDELPVLEHALLRMWDRARSVGRTSIEAADFDAVCAPWVAAPHGESNRAYPPDGEPMLSFAIDNHASEIYDALTPLQRAVARQFFLMLVERREGRDIRRPQLLQDLLSQVGNDAHAALIAVIDAFRAHGAGFVQPAAGRSIGPDDPIDISHESLFRRWHRFQTWLAEEDLDVAEFREWEQRAKRRKDGGGWLDENDCERAQRWRARVSERGNPRLWAARYSGPGSYELVDDYIQSSLNRVDQVKAEQEARKESERLAKERELEQAKSLAEAQRQRADQQASASIRQRRLSWALFALLALAVGIGIYGGQKRVAAEDQRKLALSRQLAAQAINEIGLAPQVAFFLAVAAYRIAPVQEARHSLQRVLMGHPQLRAFLSAHRDSVFKLAFSPNGKMLASASNDQTVILWNVASRKPLGEPLRGHHDAVTSVTFSPDGTTLATASNDKTVILWDVASRKPLGEPLRGHEGAVNSVAFSLDGRMLATASDDQAVILWDVTSRKPLGEPLKRHQDAVMSVAFNADGRTLASASRDRTVILWDVAGRKPLGEPLQGHQDAIYDVAFSSDGATLASASRDKTVILWDVTSRAALGEPLRGHQIAVYGVAFSPDGRTLASASADQTVILWDVASRRPLGEPLQGHQDAVYGVAFSPDGETLASASSDQTLILWNAANRGPLVELLKGHQDAVISVAYSPDRKTLASASRDRTVILWDVASRKPLGEPLQRHGDAVYGVAFSPDGKTLASASSDRTVILWDTTTREPLGESLRGHGDVVNGVAFSHDGKTLVSVSSDRTAILWDVESRNALGDPLRGHRDAIYGVAFSPDGGTFASASEDRTVILWDVASRKPLGEPLRGHHDAVMSVAFSPDGKVLATVGRDKRLMLWDVTSRKPLGEPLKGHQDAVISIAFSPDGTMIATTSLDQTVVLWDAASRKSLGEPLKGRQTTAYGVAFSPGGETLATASSDQTVKLWDVDVASWLRQACAIANRNLKHKEWVRYVAE